MALRRFAVVLVLAAACSSDTSQSGPIALADLREAFATYRCNAFVRCGVVESVSICRTLRIFTASPQYDGLFTDDDIGAAEAGTIPYDGDSAGQCLATFFSTCDHTYLETPRARSEACDHIFTATLAASAPCAFDGECISNLCNLTANCMGTCYPGTALPPRPHLGESCVMNSNCIDSYCDGSTQVCTALLRRGDPCNSDAQCQPGLAMRNGTCEPLAATGAMCSSSTDCASVGDVCNGMCTKMGLTGSECTSDTQCSPVYRCDITSGTCTLRPRRGDTCSAQQSYCIDDSYCDTTTMKCTAPLPDGATCNTSTECESQYCDFGTLTCMGSTQSCF